MKNILITGGAGFIGSNLAISLKEKGYKVSVLDNLSPQIHGTNPKETSPLYNKIIKNKIRFIKGSVIIREDLKKAMAGQHSIIHLAAETGTGQSMYEIERYVKVNEWGTALLLDILTNEKHTIEKIIVASSRAIYGEGKYYCKEHGIVYPYFRNDEDMAKGNFECKCPFCNEVVSLEKTDEDSKIHPNSIYGITKQNQEEMVMLMGKTLKIPAVALRYQNVYGPGQSLSNPYTGILSIFSNLIQQGKEINIFEDGNESRDFVYIDDVVNATILSLEKEEANHNVYNVGANERKTVYEVASILNREYNGNSKLRISGNYRLGDIRHNVADITKIQNDLGYKPIYNFDKGIREFVRWVVSQKNRNNNQLYEESLEKMIVKGLLK